jgi:hypothetical protein
MYDDAAGVERVKRLAAGRGMEVSAFLRQLVREEERRVLRREAFSRPVTKAEAAEYHASINDDDEWLAAQDGS